MKSGFLQKVASFVLQKEMLSVTSALRDSLDIVPQTANEHIERLFNLSQTKLDTVVVANAGLLKSGKSSLFNALVDDETAFRTSSVRCTQENQHYQYKTFELVDTPGLDAEDCDTQEAEKIHDAADIVLFIHTVESEYDRQELACLERLRQMAAGPENFANRIIPVFSKVDRQDEHDLRLLVDKSLGQYAEIANTKAKQYFCVSNRRYFKGCEEDRPRMIERSGIPGIREYLELAAPQTQLQKWSTLCGRMAAESRAIQHILKSETEALSQLLAVSLEEGERKREHLHDKAKELIDNVYQAHKRRYNLNAELISETSF